MRMSKPCLAIISYLFFSNIFAAAPYQQQIMLKTTGAHVDNTAPFKIECTTCIKLTKQDDHNYFIAFAAKDNFEASHMTFSYFYGDEKSFCKYNANVKFWLHANGQFDCSMNHPSNLDPASTSKTCPQKIALFAHTEQTVTNLNIDW